MGNFRKFVLFTLSFCLVMSYWLVGSHTFSATPAVEKDTSFVPRRSGENKKVTFLFTNISKKQSRIYIRFLSIEFPKEEEGKWNASICTNNIQPTQDGQATEVIRSGESTPIDLCVTTEKDVGLNHVAKIVLELWPAVD